MAVNVYEISVDGLTTLTTALRVYDETITRKLRGIIGSGAYRITTSAKRSAPRKTGRLRTSIGWDWADELTAEVGTNVVYANYQEFGFKGTLSVKSHNVKTHRRTIYSVFGKRLNKPMKITVKAHTRSGHSKNMNYNGTRFMGDSFDQHKMDITRKITALITNSKL